jgi:hypothetical protein
MAIIITKEIEGKQKQKAFDQEKKQSVKLDYTAKAQVCKPKKKKLEERNDCANQGDLNHCSRASLAENVAARCSKNSQPLSAK